MSSLIEVLYALLTVNKLSVLKRKVCQLALNGIAILSSIKLYVLNEILQDVRRSAKS